MGATNGKQNAHTAGVAKDSHKNDDLKNADSSFHESHEGEVNMAVKAEVAISVEPLQQSEEAAPVRNRAADFTEAEEAARMRARGGDIEKGFQDDAVEEPENKLHTTTATYQEPPRAVVMTVFIVSMLILFGIIMLLPPLSSVPGGEKFVYRPTTVGELEFDKKILMQYRDVHSGRTMLGLASVFVLTQTFCIPGAGTTLNLLVGAMYAERLPYGELLVALPFAIICAAVGAVECWMLSFLTARQLVTRVFPEKVRWLRKLVADNQASAPILFVSLRVSPLVPAYFLNIAAPLTPLPPLHFFLASLVGCTPHAFVAVTTGATLSRLQPGESIVSRNLGQLFIMLLLAIFVCFLPVLTRRFHNRVVGHT